MYGKSEQSEGLWVGAEAKQGTTKVYRVATAYVIKNGHRLTLGIKFVVPEDTIKEVLEYLLKKLKALELEVECLYLDRGFRSIEVAKYAVILSFGDSAVGIRNNSRASQMVGCQITDLWCLTDLSRILRDKLSTAIIHENHGFGVRYFLDALTFTIVIISCVGRGGIIGLSEKLGLMILCIIDKSLVFGICRNISATS